VSYDLWSAEHGTLDFSVLSSLDVFDEDGGHGGCRAVETTDECRREVNAKPYSVLFLELIS
jgi:hypothetical protein